MKRSGLPLDSERVVFLNPRSCGLYKDGGARYLVDPKTGKRTKDIDDELNEHVDQWLMGKSPPGTVQVSSAEVFERRVLVPTYYDPRHQKTIDDFLRLHELHGVALGELIAQGILAVRGGHGSPGNDQRIGSVPYIKVSDLRALRVNVNPTNLIPEGLAQELWGGDTSGLLAWDLISPNRASSNIGEFCILLPGEERIVITKEVFVFRIPEPRDGWDPFYLLWALCLRPIRRQWGRVALMQTNREDVGDRYKEIIIPAPQNREWAKEVSKPFHDYFAQLAQAREQFSKALASSQHSRFEFIASVNEIARSGTSVSNE